MELKLNLSVLLFLLFLGGCSQEEKGSGEPPVVEEEQKEEESGDDDPDIGDLSAPGTFYDKFSDELDGSKWEKLHQLWGQPANEEHQHGGVIRENVSTQQGYAVLTSLGDQYNGDLSGPQGHTQRLGGVIKTKERFGSGRFEVKMKVVQAPDMGVLSAAWLFWYKQIQEKTHPEAYQKALDAGNIPDNGVITLNHEVDIEVKGEGLAKPLFTNWIGIKAAEHKSEEVATKRLDDNNFHIYRWDWHTGGNGEAPRIEYYIDGKLIHTATEKIPYISASFNVGNWFAWWAGYDDGSYNPPNYNQKQMLVDWVKIVPFNEPNDDWME